MNKITFKYITIELIEKIIRLKNYIVKNSSKNDNNSNTAVISIFEKTIAVLISIIKDLIQDINNIDADYTSDELFSIQRTLSQCYITIKELHKKLNFLSTDWLKLETYTFVEQLYEKHFEMHKSKNLNIILSDDYTFIETNLNKRFEKVMVSFSEHLNSDFLEESPTVIIPKLEYANPLNWTILVHELGHIDRENLNLLLSKTLMFPSKISKSEKDRLASWAEEIYCDIKAIQIIGPAYFLSLASFAILQSLVTGFGASSNSHPPFAMRLSLLFSYLDKNKLDIKTKLPDNNEGTIHSFIYSLTKNINANLLGINETLSTEPSIDDLMVFYKFIRNELIKDNDQTIDIKPIFELAEDLKRMIPIGSYRNHDSDNNNIEKLNDEGLTKEEFNKIKETLTERNAELWEILNAGWVYKVQEIIPFGLKLFFEEPYDNIFEKIETYNEKLNLLDDRLLVSIEISKLIDLIEN